MNLLLDGNYILSVPYFCFYFYRGNILGGTIWPHLWLPLHNDQRPRYTRKFPATNSLINCSTVRKYFCKDIFVELVVGIQSILMAQNVTCCLMRPDLQKLDRHWEKLLGYETTFFQSLIQYTMYFAINTTWLYVK